MKQTAIRALALCLTTSFAAGLAYAQDDSTKSRTSQPGSSSIGGPGTGSRAASAAGYTQAGKSVRLSKLINSDIKNQQGESLGQVQDLVVDPGTGDIQFVVISPGATAAGRPGTGTSVTTPGITPGTTPPGRTTPGIGITSGNLVALPWSLVRHSGMDQFTANVDRTKLLSAPSFSASTWPTMDSTWSQRVHSHFGVDATGTPGTGTGRDISTPETPRNPVTPGVPQTPGTPDISEPGTTPTPVTPLPGTRPGTGTGTPGSR